MLRVLCVVALSGGVAFGQGQPKEKPKGIAPTHANVKYGEHPRQVLDFYKAKSDTPTPLVFCIHGGGWMGGDKSGYRTSADRYLKAGISVAAINYRLIPQALEAKIDPPVKAPLTDAARALQFVRSQAKEWNIDPTRIGATGSSAGACSSLWLLYHDDMADPKSMDPIARESTRLMCAAVNGAQTTLDPKVVREWMPNARYGGHSMTIPGKYSTPELFQAFLDKRDDLLPLIREYSPASHVTPDDPPAFLDYGSQKKPPVKGEEQADPTHSALYGMILMETQTDNKPEMILSYPGKPHEKYKNAIEYLIGTLKK